MVPVAVCQPGLMQVICTSSLLFRTPWATPGETICQFPSLLERVHVAPVVGGVVMAMFWLDPLITVAQPDMATPSAATAATVITFIWIGPPQTVERRRSL